MKATILIGSGHINSRCFELGKIVKEQLEENKISTDLIQIKDLNIHECLGCEYCLSHQNECIIQDDMQDLYPVLDQTNYLILISPVYFSNIPAELKKVIDRCQLYFNLKDKSKITPKRFLAIHVGGAPSYLDQFESFKLTYKVLLPDFKAKLIDFIGISNSDRIDPINDNESINRIKNGVEKLITEEI